MTKVPNWMTERIRMVEYLRARGYDSALLAHSTESDVKRLYEKEKQKGK